MNLWAKYLNTKKTLINHRIKSKFHVMKELHICYRKIKKKAFDEDNMHKKCQFQKKEIIVIFIILLLIQTNISIITANLEYISIYPSASAKPSDFRAYSNAQNPDIDGFYSIFWDESFEAIEYRIYENTNLILVKLSNEPRIIDFSNKENGIYYYYIEAFNYEGPTASNMLEIRVEKNNNPFFIWTHSLDNPDRDGYFEIHWNSIPNVLHYVLYKNNEIFKDAIQGSVNFIRLQINQSGDFDFYLIAYFSNGEQTSNHIIVYIRLDNDSFGIFGSYGMTFLIIGFVGTSVVVILFLRRKRYKKGTIKLAETKNKKQNTNEIDDFFDSDF